MGLLSSTTSASRYKVDGELEKPIIETVAEALNKYSIREIDNQPSDQSIGWTSFQTPFEPDFDKSPFLIGTYFVFSMRVDKKVIPPKLLQKHFASESAKRLKALERDFLSADEKKALKDQIVQRLNQQMPATPTVYDLVWQYEKKVLWFYSNLKSANEHIETLFYKSFGIHLIRQIPYTMAAFDPSLTDDQKDELEKIAFTDKED